jgi:hypothetical protein
MKPVIRMLPYAILAIAAFTFLPSTAAAAKSCGCSVTCSQGSCECSAEGATSCRCSCSALGNPACNCR